MAFIEFKLRRTEGDRYILGILNENTLRQKEGAFFLPQLNYLKNSGERVY